MKKILILSNMYPNDSNPAYGIFVKKFVNQVESLNISYDKIVMYKSNSTIKKIFNYIYFFAKTIFTLIFFKYEVIYVHYPSITGIPVLLVSLFKNITVYTNVHGTDVLPVTKLEKKLTKNTSKLLKKSKKVIVPSSYYETILIKEFLVPSKIIYIYPSGGINTDVFYPMEHNDKDLNAIYFGMVGRIVEEKGWKILVEALERFKAEDLEKNINIIIVGEGKDRDRLLQKLNGFRSFINIEYFSFTDHYNLNIYYNKFDALIFPTYKESLGLVALEAMATGTPVIASDIPPLNNYIENKKNGLLFDKGSSYSLKEQMQFFMMLKQKELDILHKNAFNESRNYSEDNVKKILEKIFS